MKKVTAFVGTPQKKHTYHATEQFLESLRSRGGVETELVPLSDYRLEICRGCKTCFEKGEEFCPLKDDRDTLLEKMRTSDGVVFATPNFSFHVSGLMKVFLDRLGFVFHRPAFFGKTFTSIVAQGIYGGHKIVDYLDFVGQGLGFNTVKGRYFTAFEPMKAKEIQRADRALADLSRRFYERLIGPAYPPPGWVRFMAFRMGRTSIRLELDERNRDHHFYKDKGWFGSDYYYPTRLSPLKRVAGPLFDLLAKRLSKERGGKPTPR